MNGSHYLPLVAISFVVAILASYAALDLSGRVSEARGTSRRLWLLGGSIAMGVGIWSMHFIAMLSFHLPTPIRYDIPLLLTSVAIAVVASLLALTVVSRPAANLRNLLTAAPLMGAAIAGMHYTGMAAMRVPAEVSYQPSIVALSVAIAVAASLAALWLSLRFREESGRFAALGKGASALVMGLAICGMHYTAMAAVSFDGEARGMMGNGSELLATRGLAGGVIVGTLVILALAFLGIGIDRRVRRELATTAASADAVLQAEIVERLEVQKRLRESEESYRSLFNSLTELVYVLDPDGHFLDVNDAVERAYGYSRAEIIGNPRAMLADPDRASTTETLARVRHAAAGTSQQYETWGRRKNGEVFPIEVVLSPARYFGEVAVLAAGRDITDRKRAQTDLAAAEAHYRLLIETSPYGIFTCDREGCLVDVNPAAEQIFGRRDVIGLPFVQLLVDEDGPAFRRACEALVGEAVARRELELRLQRARGEAGLLVVTLTEVKDRGAVPTVYGIVRDITAERQQQEQLRRAERLAGVGTLIGGVAHELNNPLTAIQSYAELMLLEERAGEDREALETMKREAHRAARIVSDLRLVARGTQDATQVTQDRVDVNDVVEHVLKLRRYVLATHNVEVHEVLDSSRPWIRGDRGQLEQIILNLVVNAEQAMAGSPNPRLAIHTFAEQAHVVVEIADTGSGIDPGDLDRIFDPFFTTKNPGDGTGLGLSLAHRLASDNGGSITVRSELEVGTTFTLKLPRVESSQREGLAIPRSSAAGTAEQKLRVLVVDDEPGIRQVLQRYLQRRGHEVDAAADGAEALSLVGADLGAPGRYDLIVSDLRMPGLSGEELLEALQARGDGLDERIIFISGDAASHQTMRLIEAAAVPIIFKPFELAELSRRIEQFAGSTRRSEKRTEPVVVR
ncbi:MAG: MHYT domain-containing protein [Gemmatimonadota bacterium]